MLIETVTLTKLTPVIISLLLTKVMHTSVVHYSPQYFCCCSASVRSLVTYYKSKLITV